MTRAGSERWDDPDVVAQYATSTWSDEGERLALEAAQPWARGDVLDIGVGGGRTTVLLAPGARRYTRVEPSEAMLALARRRHPDVSLLADDARTLATQPDAVADLVVFSFNGIDSVDHDDRRLVLEQLARVTRPDGRVLLSSLNRDGVSFDEHPLGLRGPSVVARARSAARLALHPVATVRSVRNFRLTRSGAADGDGWSMRAMRAHEFRFLVHFATVGSTVRDLRAAGLVPEAAWADSGRVVDLAAEHDDADWVHYLCRRA